MKKKLYFLLFLTVLLINPSLTIGQKISCKIIFCDSVNNNDIKNISNLTIIHKKPRRVTEIHKLSNSNISVPIKNKVLNSTTLDNEFYKKNAAIDFWEKQLVNLLFQQGKLFDIKFYSTALNKDTIKFNGNPYPIYHNIYDLNTAVKSVKKGKEILIIVPPDVNTTPINPIIINNLKIHSPVNNRGLLAGKKITDYLFIFDKDINATDYEIQLFADSVSKSPLHAETLSNFIRQYDPIRLKMETAAVKPEYKDSAKFVYYIFSSMEVCQDKNEQDCEIKKFSAWNANSYCYIRVRGINKDWKVIYLSENGWSNKNRFWFMPCYEEND